MSIGVYSPTIQYVYKRDSKWFEKYIDPLNSLYDRDGYDQFGYDRNGVDRAGHTKYDYQESEIDADGNTLYIEVMMEYNNYNPINGG
jgi:hypothetical protein